MQSKAEYDLDRKAVKISALSSNILDKYEYLTGEDLGLNPSTVEQAKFEYSSLGKIFKKGLDKDEDKEEEEGLLKILKNIEKNQKSNNNDKSNLSSAKSESSSARSESSKKTLFTDDVANNLEPKIETQTSFKYLKNNTEVFFDSFPNIFDSDLPEFFNYIASEEKKNIDYKLLSTQIFLPSGKSFNFLYKYNELYNFWFNLLFKNLNLADVK